MPAELDGIITGIYGLDNRKVMRRRGRNRGVQVTERIAAVPGAPTGFFLGDLARLHDFSDGDGKGQSIGLLEFGCGLLPDVLTAFCQQAGIDVPNIVPVSVDNAPTDTDDGVLIEVTLDIEVVAGVCPKAKIPVYFAPNLTERAMIDTIDQENNPFVLSISFGDYEELQRWPEGTLDQVNEAFQEAALMGLTICVAAGDDGSDDGAGDGLAYCVSAAGGGYHAGTGCDAVTG